MRSVVTLNGLALSLALSSPSGSFAQAGDASSDVAPAQLIQSMEAAFGVHPGQRRNHTKGTCASGEFIGTPAAAQLSRSPLFTGKSIPVVARFSIGGGDPDVADTARTVRGMALEFRVPGGALHHMTMINTPMFVAARPADFNALLIAAKPDPKTGTPDPKTFGSFLASHPAAMVQIDFVAHHNPPRDYYSSTYFAIHTFRFIDAGAKEHLVRWRFAPQAGEVLMSDAELKSAPHDFLELGLLERTQQRPVRWDMIVSVGEPNDPQVDPTVLWPDARPHFTAGTLTISQASPQHGAPCEKINFDPLVMADGIAPTSDPILLFRSPAYAVSFARRLSGQ